MRERFAVAAVTLALLGTTLAACSDDPAQVVVSDNLPSALPTPPPSIPTDPKLVRYVSPDGKNSNPGTLDRPWRTLTHAFTRVYSKQVLYVRGGTYREQITHVPLHPGTPDGPITVLAYPGENPVLEGTVSLRRPKYWLIDNLDVRGDPSIADPPSFMVKIIGGHHWGWQNSSFSGTAGRANVMITGWGFGEPDGFSFSGNCLHDLPNPPQGSSNLFLGSMPASAHGVVSRNVVFNDDDQPNLRLGSGAGAPNRVEITKNTIWGGSLGLDVRGRPHHVRVSRNVVGGGTAPALIRFSHGLPRGTYVTNNVAVNAQQLLRPEVRKIVHGFGNLVLTQNPEFVDTQRCDGFRSGLDAMIPYGVMAP